jgi:hypothetical protein
MLYQLTTHWLAPRHTPSFPRPVLQGVPGAAPINSFLVNEESEGPSSQSKEQLSLPNRKERRQSHTHILDSISLMGPGFEESSLVSISHTYNVMYVVSKIDNLELARIGRSEHWLSQMSLFFLLRQLSLVSESTQ